MHKNKELQQWLERLQNHGALPAIELKLERIQNFLARIGNPHLHLPPLVHIAGTNGKGSTLAFIHAIIEAAGLKAHRYTSPHLVRFNERFIIANEQISDAALLAAFQALEPNLTAHPLTYFEATTALGFWLFAQNKADFTLLEVGMGGRFDATNVVSNPSITAITPISLDHQEFLGETIAKIAFEKAGIIKEGAPCVVGVQHSHARQVIEIRAHELNAPLFRHGVEWNFEILPNKSLHYISESLNIITPPPALLGEHQYQNAALAIACVDMLSQNSDLPLPLGEGRGVGKPSPIGRGLGEGFYEKAIQIGIAKATWQGRLQQISLKNHGIDNQIFVDGGHNEAGAESIVSWLQSLLKPPHLIMGLKADKDAHAFISKLAPFCASLHFVPVPDVDCHSPQILQQMAVSMGFTATAHSDILEAANNIPQQQTILITGSLYLVGEALSLTN
jgi:dihydrofolate synthase/folylpolyglutamate synthase